MNINLIVLYSYNHIAAKDFYEALGMDFKEEKHGNGPKHYAAVMDNGTVFEIYPDEDDTPVDYKMLIGVEVDNLHEVMNRLKNYHLYKKSGSKMSAMLVDPDGRSVLVVQN